MSTSSERSIRVGVVGLGYWGPNLARNLQRVPGCELAWCCDLDEQNRARFASQFPSARFTDRLGDLLGDDDLDAVVVATGSSTHHPIGAQVLDAGKHLFVEKPLALRVADAADLVARAERHGVQLMVGHLLRFHPAFAKVSELVESGALGRVLYLYTNRQNFGKVRQDENALWSLAPHDLSLALALAGSAPQEVSARGECYLQPGIEDVVFGYVRFGSGAMAHLHVSWLDPHKRRMLTVVGTEAMAVFDDTEADRKVTVYEKTAWPARFETWGEFQALQSGDIHIPRITADEPLQLEMRAFVEAVRTGTTPIASGAEGLAVVRTLAALQESLDDGGRPVQIDG
jgi:predicted dehydrogenase